MKIVKILGGLGNQMFQYALYLSLKERYPEENIKIDYSYFNGYSLHNGLEINKIFNIIVNQASFKDLFSVTWPLFNYKIWRIGVRILPHKKQYFETNNSIIEISNNKIKENCYLDGYWQDERYFQNCTNIIRKIYTFKIPLSGKNEIILQKIKKSNSVSIHVRRGDYLKHKMYLGICDETYYNKAIEYIKSKISMPSFFIFSNDIKWCEANFRESLNGVSTTFIDWNIGENSYTDMQLMSECKHNIIANSSFSWWGAWLNGNRNKIVISPKIWLNNNKGIHPQKEDWILL